jgi:toxin ParE1/3/4
MQLVWMPRARRERHDAIEFIAQDNPQAALGQLDRIEQQTDMLRQHPKLGRPGRVKGTRELVISRTPFIVIYRLAATRIELLRVLHGAQQWP